MGAREVQQSLSINDIYNILSFLGGDPRIDNDNQISSLTICHGGDSHKLVYYDNSKTFICFTDDCGRGLSIYDIIMLVNDIDFYNSYKYVCDFFKIDRGSFVPTNKCNDFSFFKKMNRNRTQDTYKELEIYDERVLSHFYDYYHIDWLQDGISVNTMIEFGIKFSIENNQIIIPHYNIDNELIGIRVRNLNPELIDTRKYMPLYHEGKMYNHRTGFNIYGLNITKYNIKQHRKIILFEGEKSVQQLHSFMPEMSVGGAISGNTLDEQQIQILKDMGCVDEVIIAMDKEFKNIQDEEGVFSQSRQIRQNMINNLLPYFKVSVMWDVDDIVDYKQSPTDMGKDIFLELFNNRIKILQ